jgi:cyclophilin family peptidyl-prolyl cis-trans isomerase
VAASHRTETVSVVAGAPYAAAPMPSRLLALALVAALAAAGCGSNKPSKTSTTKRPPPGGAAVPTGCKAVPKPKAQADGRLDKPALTGRPPARATIQTNCGDIVIAFDKHQPKTAASFAYLAGKRFFDGTTFWRVQRTPDGGDFVIQGGDPTNSGTGGPGYSVTERPSSKAQYTRGIVAMAKTEIEPPGTSGSQFFIVTGEDAGLPPDYAVLGKVVGGEDAVARIAAARSDPASGRATQAAVIESVQISG